MAFVFDTIGKFSWLLFRPPKNTMEDLDDGYLREQVADEEVYKPTFRKCIDQREGKFIVMVRGRPPGMGH